MSSAVRFDLTLSDAKKICKKYELETPSRIIRFENGMINDVFSLDEKYVIKINTGSPEIKRFHKEKGIYEVLKKHNIPCPEFYVYDDTNKLIPHTFIILEHVRGKPLSQLWTNLNKKVKRRSIVQLGELLAKVHSITFDDFGENFKNGEFVGFKTFKEYLGAYVTSIAKNLARTNSLGKDKISKMKEFFHKDSRFHLHCKGTLQHGNYVPDNIIFKEDKISGVVDWEWARSTHNEEEVAIFLYRILKMEESNVNAFLKGYTKIVKLDKDFEKRLFAYNLLYYLRVLPSVSGWKHRPEKQKEYFEETEKLFKKVIEKKSQ